MAHQRICRPEGSTESTSGSSSPEIWPTQNDLIQDKNGREKKNLRPNESFLTAASNWVTGRNSTHKMPVETELYDLLDLLPGANQGKLDLSVLNSRR